MRISDWSSDVLDVVLAGVLEPIGQATADLVAGCPGQADAAGLGQALQAGRDVDAVAVDIVVLVDDVAEVDADAEADALGLWAILFPLGHALLDQPRTLEDRKRAEWG